jgi:zinc transport system permease protein
MPFPFEPLFMRYALIAVLLIGPMYALLGTMVVSRGMTFFSESLGHGALCGVAIGAMLGFADSPLALVSFGILYALLLFAMQRRATLAADALIGVLSSLTVALGVVLLSQGGGFAKFSALLVGDLLSVAPQELIVLAVALAAVIVYWCLCYNQLLLLGVSAPLASSRGVRTRLVHLSFTLLIAVIVMLSIRYVGTLIINAMLILPAAAARGAAKGMRSYQAIAVLIAVVCGVAGLAVSYYLGTAAGATIVLLMGFAFLITFFAGRRRI